jgi:hypothetical protein
MGLVVFRIGDRAAALAPTAEVLLRSVNWGWVASQEKREVKVLVVGWSTRTGLVVRKLLSSSLGNSGDLG